MDKITEQKIMAIALIKLGKAFIGLSKINKAMDIYLQLAAIDKAIASIPSALITEGININEIKDQVLKTLSNTTEKLKNKPDQIPWELFNLANRSLQRVELYTKGEEAITYSIVSNGENRIYSKGVPMYPNTLKTKDGTVTIKFEDELKQITRISDLYDRRNALKETPEYIKEENEIRAKTQTKEEYENLTKSPEYPVHYEIVCISKEKREAEDDLSNMRKYLSIYLKNEYISKYL